MINTKNFTDIVRKTLSRMDVQEPSLVMLIKGTLAAESGLELLSGTDSYGMMRLTKVESQNLYNEILKYSQKLKDKVFAGTGIDLNRCSYEDFIFHINSSIPFMVAMMYVYYTTSYKELPENTLDASAKIYVKYFVKEDSQEAEIHFKDTFRSIFLDK